MQARGTRADDITAEVIERFAGSGGHGPLARAKGLIHDATEDTALSRARRD
jgi:hypothetical protein